MAEEYRIRLDSGRGRNGQEFHREALPLQLLLREASAHRRGPLLPRVRPRVHDPEGGHPGHSRGLPVPRHEEALHRHRPRFLLVYSIDSAESFRIVKDCFQEIREQKSDFQEVPIVVVGNKSDVGEERRAVPKEDAAEWLFCELPRLRAKILECSAKDNANIKEIFRAFLQLSKLPLPAEGLRRRSSAHATGSTANGASNRLQCPPEGGEEAAQHSSSSSASQRSFKPRSRSLIRRTSKKVQKMKDAAAASQGHHGQHRRLLHIVNFSFFCQIRSP
ncbi:GTP-binding protein Di-Ras2 [Caerostris extrusa]|uniref:GTP-binding protein Di-Ras2 n=1 Tax=Caerostris extrusa TaxID=172846 RepID=A0AAV4XLB0_CAEEX|nr:GTP-binding protein Di-Ras2 [Caerostris extrusa]